MSNLASSTPPASTPTTTLAAAVAVRPGYRLVPALIGRSTEPGTIVYVECPDWCTVDHVASRNVFLEDINHEGERAALQLPSDYSAPAPVEVYLSQWPASKDDKGLTRLAVDVDYEVSTYGRTAALAFADQLVAFAANVRALAETLPEEAKA
ncbi:DUF6907 domain-containing protein [Streptomyces sp. MPA0124]|uniref:DUF6907 domain-containing protein n=1 Tax=Streptomyces sp. MPA0124 TaxID=3378069 RepID=UPI0038554F64